MKESDVSNIANDALSTFQEVESRATEKLNNHGSDAAVALAAINTLNGSVAVDRIASIANGETQSLLNLVREPAISRITVENDDREVNTYYICRTTGVALKGAKLASYRSEYGKLASRDAGEEVAVRVGDNQVWLRILENLELRPCKAGDQWDSVGGVWRREDEKPQTIPSLRKLIAPSDQDDFALMLAGDADTDEQKIVEGLRHQIRNAMALRDQAILDKFQDDIFRLPIDRQLMILGPPGTGKTTTLIKRLGQKLDWDALDEHERSLLDAAHYRSSWVMFTPSELLKHYVKEAFSRENVPASDEHIKTWAKRRHELARSVFGILKTNTGGTFILKEDRQHCSREVIDNPCQWFDAFQAYHRRRILESLQEGATLLHDASSEHARPIIEQILGVVPHLKSEQLLGAYATWDGLEGRLEPLLKASREKTEKLIKEQGNLLYNRNKKVFYELADLLDSVRQADDEDEDGAEFDDDVPEDTTQPTHNKVQDAAQAYRRFLQAYARSRYRGRSLGKGSRAAQIKDWLGDRAPSDVWLKNLGAEMSFQNALRRFRSAWKRYVLDVPASYRAFRRQCLITQRYGYQGAENPAYIDVFELDAILLLMLRSARELILQDFVKRNLDKPKFFELARISNQFQCQVLVDEATDFSALQLACMESLSHPRTQSFFACGDFNQRITGHGLRSLEQLQWISGRLKDHRINTVYRQSRILNKFASELLNLMGGDLKAAGNLPMHSTHEGVKPVLAENLRGEAVAEWLAARIGEIERMVRQTPSIAVLVTAESHVKPMAEALTERLESINLRAVACVDGQSLGDETDVRVFDIQHIKGLEFEAAFFVGVDELVVKKPELFERYMYVGATRAATYLGMTCNQRMPAVLEALKPRFVGHW